MSSYDLVNLQISPDKLQAIEIVTGEMLNSQEF